MTLSGDELADAVIDYYSDLIQNIDFDAVAQLKQPLRLPIWPVDNLSNLMSKVKDLFATESVSLQLTGSVVIIGDLHGQLLDLLRIVRSCGFPIAKTFLFLGDIVDRGEFSVETCTIVFALKIKYADSVFVIRGNHEFGFLSQRCGFKEEIESVYGESTLYQNCLSAFSMIPLTAVVNEKMLCVHGGIGPGWFSVGQARRLERPIDEFGDELLDTMLWSDPTPTVDFYEPSPRGTGFFFGERAVAEFLDANSLTMLVRAHECVNTGCQFLFENKCATVFSASNYGGLVSNNSAVLEVNSAGDYSVRQFPPLQYLKRAAVQFGKVVDGKFVGLQPKAIAPKGKAPVPKLPRLPGLASSRGNSPRVPSRGWCESTRLPCVHVPHKF
jgi:protein phosphatase